MNWVKLWPLTLASLTPGWRSADIYWPIPETLFATLKINGGPFRAVPEIILGGPHIFFQTPPPQDTHGIRAPRSPGHISALINLPHYGSNMP